MVVSVAVAVAIVVAVDKNFLLHRAHRKLEVELWETRLLVIN